MVAGFGDEETCVAGAGATIPGIGRGTNFGGSFAKDAVVKSSGWRRINGVLMIKKTYILPDCIMRGPIRKMGSIEPVNTNPISTTAIAKVMKLMTCVKSAMIAAVSSS